jgi:hypothetical protein
MYPAKGGKHTGVDGVFLKADPGFDAEEFTGSGSEKNIEATIKSKPRNGEPTEACQYFDEQLYKRRFVMERTNAWIDSFKALLICFEVTIKNWMAQHWMAFPGLLLRKIITC